MKGQAVTQQFDILGIGAVVMDELILLERYPQADEKIEVRRIHHQMGSPVPAALKTAAHFGCRTAFIGSIGDDPRGQEIEEHLIKAGIDTGLLIRQPGKHSGYASIWIDQTAHTRTIAYHPGDLTPFTIGQLQPERLPAARCIHIDGREHDVVPQVLKQYRQQGSWISIDTGNFRERTPELLPLADIIIMPRRFPREIFGDLSLKELLARTVQKWPKSRLTVITDGINGSVWHSRGQSGFQAAFKVSAVDTTGAGDTHAGALLAALLEGQQPDSAVQFAAASAALKCTAIGTSRLPVREAVTQLLQTGTAPLLNG